LTGVTDAEMTEPDSTAVRVPDGLHMSTGEDFLIATT
jgi:hypothetical protein